VKRIIGGLLAIALLAVPAAGMPPGPSRIRATAALLSQQAAHGTVVAVYALHNRPAYPGRIGTAFVRCQPAGGGYLECAETLVLRRGEILAFGVVSAAAGFRQLAVVGGSGYYANAGGEMTVQPLGGGQLILVDLEGF
jgi:hypothetical protein